MLRHRYGYRKAGDNEGGSSDDEKDSKAAARGKAQAKTRECVGVV